MLEQHVTGLQTDYKWNESQRQSGAAVAVSGPATVGRFVRASRRDTDSVAKQLAARLATIERLELARWIKELEQPNDVARRLRRVFRDQAQNEPDAFSLMRAEQPFKGRAYYHLTGEKLYAIAPGGIESCKINLSFDGVVSTNRTGKVAFENVTASAWAEYCGDAAMWYEPIATLSIGDPLLWVAGS